MIVLQSRVPEDLVLVSWWLLPAIETVLLVALIAANPGKLGASSRTLHRLSLALVAVASLANGWAAVSLVVGLVNGTIGKDAGSLLFTGGNIWVTNIVVFSLWYWDLDRGGPGARAPERAGRAGLHLPADDHADLAPHDWEPALPRLPLPGLHERHRVSAPTDTIPVLTAWSRR